jgi:phosphoesterase RecJ-like protein
LDKLIELILAAQTILLTTHRQCDGDGLGAELAIFHALKKMGKKVSVVNVDPTPRKYRFLNPDEYIQYFEVNPSVDLKCDLALIFDTNDERLVEPLYTHIKPNAKTIAFVDHHPVLKQGPQPTLASLIDITAASTGEMAYNIIKQLKISIDQKIATCIYTSIAFDTQLFRYVRDSARSHEIAADIIGYQVPVTNVHRHLFGNQTVNKMAFLAKALGQIEYHFEGRLAVIRLRDADLFHYNLDPDDSRDVIDMVMNIETLEAAILFREDATNAYKMSLRSKGSIEVLSVAEALGGGGHMFAAGAYVRGEYDQLKNEVVRHMMEKLQNSFNAKKEKK